MLSSIEIESGELNTANCLAGVELDINQYFECPEGEAINMFDGIYDQQSYDRKFRFGCTKVASKANCSWTDYVNDYDKPVQHNCDGYIGGIQSIHSNGVEDRKWKIQCCNPGTEIQKMSCITTSFINDFKGRIEFKLKADNIFVGLESYHENSQE